MSKVVKEMVMDEMTKRLGECRDLLVVDVSGISGVTANELRIALQAKGISLLGVRNSLARKVLKGEDGPDLGEVLQGPSTFAIGGEDIVALSKEISQWAKQIEKLEIKGGTVDGQVVDAAGVDSLSKSPSRLELISQISGLLLSPGASLSGALLGAGGKLAGQIKKISEGSDDEAA